MYLCSISRYCYRLACTQLLFLSITCKLKIKTPKLIQTVIDICFSVVSDYYLTNCEPSFSCICAVIDHEFHHNIVKVAMDPRGDSQVDPRPSGSADYFDNVMMKFIVNNRTDALKTDINLFFMINKLLNCCSHSLIHHINYTFMCLFAYRVQR